MLSKAKISSITRLHQRKFRDASGLFIVEGAKSVGDLLRSSLTVEELFATTEWCEKNRQFCPSGVVLTEVAGKELERISAWKTPQPVLAIVHKPDYKLEDISVNCPMLLLDDLRDPGNLGTIIRTADWFGIRQIVCSENSVEWSNPKVVQATMGSFTRVKTFYVDLVSFISQKLKGKRILGTFLEGTPLKQMHLSKNDIFIIGNEANGITDAVKECVSDKVLIQSGIQGDDKAESLNAAIAAAIMMYELS